MRPQLASFLQELASSGVPISDLLAQGTQAGINYNPLLAQQPAAPQSFAAPPPIQVKEPDLSVVPKPYTWTAQRRIEPEQVTAEATGGVGASASIPSTGEYTGVIGSLLNTESGGNYAADNGLGYVGRLQFGAERLSDASAALGLGPISLEEFKNDPALQNRVENWHFADIDRQLEERGVTKYIGQEIGGVPITRDGLIAMSHLGGVGGAEQFVKSGGQYNPSDAFGTSLSDYGRIHAGSGEAPQQESDMAPKSNIRAFMELLGGNGDTALAGGPSADQMAVPISAPDNPVSKVSASAGKGLAGFLQRMFGTPEPEAASANVGGTLGDFFQSLLTGPAGGPIPTNQVGATGTATGGVGGGASMTPQTASYGPAGGPVPSPFMGNMTGGAGAGASGAGNMTFPNTGGGGSIGPAGGPRPLGNNIPPIIQTALAAQAGGGATAQVLKSVLGGALGLANPGELTKPAAPIAATGAASAGTAQPAQTQPQQTTAATSGEAATNNGDQRRLNWQMLGVGLGQMSHGDRVDLSGVLEQHARRQEEAQARVAEIMQERQRQEERLQDRAWGQEDLAAKAALEREQFDYEQSAAAEQKAAEQAVVDAGYAQTQKAVAARLPEDEAALVLGMPPKAGAEFGTQLLTATSSEERAAIRDEAARAAEQEMQIAKEGRDVAGKRIATADERAANVAEANGILADKAADMTDPNNARAARAARMVIAGGGNATVNEMMDNLKPPASTNVNVDTGSKEAEKGNNDTITKRADALDVQVAQGQQLMPSMAAAKAALDRGASTGWLDKMIYPMRQALVSIGGMTPEGVADLQGQQLIDAVTGIQTQLSRQANSGVFTDSDYTHAEPASVGLSREEDVNRLFVQNWINTTETLSAKQSAMDAYRSEHPNDLGFEAAWRKMQASGDAPASMYIMRGLDDTAAIEKAMNNGYIKPGDIFYFDDGAGSFTAVKNTTDSSKLADGDAYWGIGPDGKPGVFLNEE